jgi:alkylation response protein AidB-like acyl-CoA dehydrogenase
MDLEYGARYEELRAEVRAFLASHWPPRPAAGRSRQEDVRGFRERAVERGYLLRGIPRRYGGSEQPPDELAAIVIREEFARARAPLEYRGIGTMMLVPTLLECGSEWQKQHFVPPSVRGEMLWCQGYSEPGAGSDLASLRTRAELVGGEWVIHGQKIWTTNAHEADFMFALCRTEPEAPRHAGLSYLLVPMKQPGIRVRPLRQMTGGADFNEVFLDGARTPADWIVGRRGDGWQVSRTTLRHERNSIGSSEISLQVFQGLVQLARSTTRGGRPAIEDPCVRQRLVALEGRVRSHQYSGYRQLTRSQRGEDPGLLGLMNKLVSTGIGHEVARIALDLLGEGGLLAPLPDAGPLDPAPAGPRPWVAQYLGSLALAIAGGTANIQRNVIGERGLGLPRDAHADRGPGR